MPKLKIIPLATASLLTVLAFLQFVRFTFGWGATIHGISIPYWASGVATIVLGGFAGVNYWFWSRL